MERAAALTEALAHAAALAVLLDELSAPRPQGRPRKWESDAARKAAWRKRQAEAAAKTEDTKGSA